MNRERLLFVSVLAIVALWFFVIRDDVKVIKTAKSGAENLPRLRVASANYAPVELAVSKSFTLRTNVVAHPRPDLGPSISQFLGEPVPKPYTIPNVWPPMSRSVSLERLGWLRRWSAPLQEGGTLMLPDLPEEAAAKAAGPTEDRVDTWRSFKQDQRGRVQEITVNGKKIREPRQLPKAGDTFAGTFWHYLCLLEADPERARTEGVTEVRAKIEGLGAIKQEFGKEITDVRVAAEGKQKGLLTGYKRFLKLPKVSSDARYKLGRDLLQEGVRAGDKSLIAWSLEALKDAKEQIPAKGAQPQRRKILLVMLDAANRLNQQELVLQLAFEHLAAFPDEEAVLEYVGNILASRSFGQLDFAAQWFERARASTYAQQRLVEVLVELGEFDRAKAVVESGRVGGGAEVDLLRARVALALGDLDTAADLAQRRTGSSDDLLKAEAYQILGAADYVKGDAAAAEANLLEALAADPGRSTAYSDLGFALAVQGKAAGAITCFDRALKLDPIDNSVAPKVGKAYLKLAVGDTALLEAEKVQPDPRDKEYLERKRGELKSAGEAAYGEAAEMLTALQEEDPSELFVRYLLAYAKEKTGNLEEAANLYRDTIDSDFRYRIAIARLGLVQAARVEAGGDRKYAEEARAHLEKAVKLNPKDAVLPYILGRFLLNQRMDPVGTKKSFLHAKELPINEVTGNLPLWAHLGEACLAYRKADIDDAKIKARLNALLERIKDLKPPGSTEAQLMEDEVYRAGRIALEIVSETQAKVDKTWGFLGLTTRPPDWKYNNKGQMRVTIARAKGLVFSGQIEYGGEGITSKSWEYCSAVYQERGALSGRNFFECVVDGTIPDDMPTGVDFAIGLVNPGKGKKGPVGIQVLRKSRTGNVSARLEGGEGATFKAMRGRDYVEMKSVPWPTGRFRLHVMVEPEYGKERRNQGRFRLFLKTANWGDESDLGVNVFEKEYGAATEKSSIFSRGRANQTLMIHLWVQGNEGSEIPNVSVQNVMVTMAKK